MTNADVARELSKAAEVLQAVDRYLTAYNESMAALHMSENVMVSPLTAAVRQASFDATQAALRLKPADSQPGT